MSIDGFVDILSGRNRPNADLRQIHPWQPSRQKQLAAVDDNRLSCVGGIFYMIRPWVNPSINRLRPTSNIMNIESLSSLDDIFPLLTGCDLPVTDISVLSPPHFFGFRVEGSVVAVIGLEQFQSFGLLRSLAVHPGYRGRGLAQALVRYVESFADLHGVESLFLLTTTAEAFFRKLGYCSASRQEAPQAIQATSQFSSLCPASSAFLFKHMARARPAVLTDSTPAVPCR